MGCGESTLCGVASCVLDHSAPSTAISSQDPFAIGIRETAKGFREFWRCEGVLGHGSFGDVYRATLRDNRQIVVAVKILNRKKVKPSSIHREWRVLESLGKHPNLVAYEGSYKTRDEVAFVLELMEGGELFDRLIQRGAIAEPDARLPFRRLAEALAYLHARGIVHRDLKPENILLKDKSEHPVMKISDFGLAQLLGPNERLLKICGTWAYAAPEMCDPSRPGYDCRFDCFSFGVILYVVLTGTHPFDPTGDLAVSEIKARARSAEFSFDGVQWTSVSSRAQDLIRRLIVRDPSNRLTSTEMLQHPWFDLTGSGTPWVDAPLNVLAKSDVRVRGEALGGFTGGTGPQAAFLLLTDELATTPGPPAAVAAVLLPDIVSGASGEAATRVHARPLADSRQEHSTVDNLLPQEAPCTSTPDEPHSNNSNNMRDDRSSATWDERGLGGLTFRDGEPVCSTTAISTTRPHGKRRRVGVHPGGTRAVMHGPRPSRRLPPSTAEESGVTRSSAGGWRSDEGGRASISLELEGECAGTASSSHSQLQTLLTSPPRPGIGGFSAKKRVRFVDIETVSSPGPQSSDGGDGMSHKLRHGLDHNAGPLDAGTPESSRGGRGLAADGVDVAAGRIHGKEAPDSGLRGPGGAVSHVLPVATAHEQDLQLGTIASTASTTARLPLERRRGVLLQPRKHRFHRRVAEGSHVSHPSLVDSLAATMQQLTGISTPRRSAGVLGHSGQMADAAGPASRQAPRGSGAHVRNAGENRAVAPGSPAQRVGGTLKRKGGRNSGCSADEERAISGAAGAARSAQLQAGDRHDHLHVS